MPPVRVLSFHADYRCRHAGACCTSNWPVPVEVDRLDRLRTAMATGRLRPASGVAGAAICDAPNGPPETPAVLSRAARACVFYETTSGVVSAKMTTAGVISGRCRIHAALGHDALPLACRQFPRVSVIDPRGVSVTLSHYCPTAAAMLDADAGTPTGVTTDAGAFPASGEYVGLDAREALPPLLRHDMLMDWESWWECERLAVAQLEASPDPTAGLALLRVAIGDIQEWSPADGPLLDRVRDAFARVPAREPSATDRPSVTRLVESVFEAIPSELRPSRLESGPQPTDRTTGRFLAAHAFASWSPHGTHGLTGWLRAIESAWALLEAGAGIRQADLLLRHLATPLP